MAKLAFPPRESWRVAALNLPETPWFILLFLIIIALVVMILSFLKQKGCFQLLAGKSSDKTVSCQQSSNAYGSQHSHNSLQWHLFSGNGRVCSRCVFRQLWNSQETCFLKVGIRPLWYSPYKAIFSTWGSWIITASNLPEKHTRSLFSLLQQLWSSFCIFWKKQAACHILLRVIWHHFT